MLAQRATDQRLLVVPVVGVTAGGLAGSLWAPLGSAAVWVLILGAAQGAALGLAIFFTILALNLLGDGLRDTLDPRLKH